MGVKPPERAEYLRVIMAELTRISNHLSRSAFLLNDLGAYFTPALYAFEERELILDIFEAVSGSRMMCNYFRFGGVARDLPEGTWMKKIRAGLRPPAAQDRRAGPFLTNNEIVARAEGRGRADTPNRPSPFDGRPDPARFGRALRHPPRRPVQHLRPLRLRRGRALPRRYLRPLPDPPGRNAPEPAHFAAGPARYARRPDQEGKPQYQVRVPAGESYGRVEGPKGELGFYVVSNGKPNPWRYHVRAPSFINLTALANVPGQ
jgi:NADH-quinone oxidoreductase subunit C/D